MDERLKMLANEEPFLTRALANATGHAVFAAVPWSRAMLSITDGGHVTQADDFEATTVTSTEFLRCERV